MEVWNNRLLLAEGNWEDVDQATESVRKLLVHRLVYQRAVPASLAIEYWASIPQSLLSTSLFYLQHLPIWSLRTFREPKKWDSYWQTLWNSRRRALPHLGLGNIRAKSAKTAQLGLPQHPSFARPFVYAFRSFRTFVSECCLQIVAFCRSQTLLYSHLAIVISDDQQSQLLKIRNDAAEKVGDLLVAAAPSDEKGIEAKIESDDDIKQHVRLVSKAMGFPDPRLDTPRQAFQVLQRLLTDSQQSKSQRLVAGNSSSVLAVDTFPSFKIRYWPLILVGSYVGLRLAGSWQDLVEWLRSDVFDTVLLFWKNWVVDPLYQIYLTIRHDPSNGVALVARESLSSDIDSLERMVIDFAREANPNLTSAELKGIAEAAGRGNVTPVMAAYEKQLSAPLWNLFTGKLIRTLLIQVQKSKVDLELALSGIDQMLQSQQLVFGIIAAIPAFTSVFYLLRITTNFVWISGSARRDRVRRTSVTRDLLTLDRVIQAAPKQLRSIDLGNVYCCVSQLRENLTVSHSIPAEQLLQQLDILQHVAISTRDTVSVLDALDRAYDRFFMALS